MTKKYNVVMSYIEPNQEDLVIKSKYVINYDENHKVDNVKELKEIMTSLIEGNLADPDNRNWLDTKIRPLLKEIEDKIYIQYYDKRYIAEKLGYDQEGNTITILNVEAYRITQKEAIHYVKAWDKGVLA